MEFWLDLLGEFNISCLDYEMESRLQTVSPSVSFWSSRGLWTETSIIDCGRKIGRRSLGNKEWPPYGHKVFIAVIVNAG
jgi:hypothetical protein